MNIHEFWKAVLVQDENEISILLRIANIPENGMEWLKEQKKWVIYW